MAGKLKKAGGDDDQWSDCSSDSAGSQATLPSPAGVSAIYEAERVPEVGASPLHAGVAWLSEAAPMPEISEPAHSFTPPAAKFGDVQWYNKFLWDAVSSWDLAVPPSSVRCFYRDLFTGSNTVAAAHEV